MVRSRLGVFYCVPSEICMYFVYSVPLTLTKGASGIRGHEDQILVYLPIGGPLSENSTKIEFKI